MPVRYLVGAVCLAAAALASGCNGVIDPSKNTVEDITGTLNVGSSTRKDFSISKNGEFEMKITALSPNADALIGVAYGPIQNGACGTFQSNPIGQLNRVVLSGVMNSGQYCVTVFDVGTISQPENYTIRFSHP